MIRQSRQYGSSMVKIVVIVSVLMIGGLTAGGFSIYRLSILKRDHDGLKNAVESEIQAISTLRVPDTKTELTQHICTMLDALDATYEPHYVRVDVEREQQRLSVQVWYQRALFDWLPQSQRMFYASAQKIGFADVIDTSVPTVAATAGEAEPTEIAVEESVVTPEPAETAAGPFYTEPLIGTDATFQELVLESPVPVLVYFSAEWCGYCRKMSPFVDAAAREFAGRVTVVKVDIDRSRRIASKYNVRGIPLSLLFRDGEVSGTRRGFIGERVLFAFIRENLY